MSEDIIDKIEAINSSTQSKTTSAEPLQRVAPNTERFENAMQDATGRNAVAAQPVDTSAATNNSPIDVLRDMHRQNRSPTLSHESLIAQTKEAAQKIEQIKHVLETPNAGVNSNTRQLLQSKLSHIDESLKVALAKTGIEYNPTAAAGQPNRINPIERFLGFLTDGQWQLERLGGELQMMSAQNKQLTPVNMLAIQVKVGQIQQELELFSATLSKGLESVKTIMNIQV